MIRSTAVRRGVVVAAAVLAAAAAPLPPSARADDGPAPAETVIHTGLRGQADESYVDGFGAHGYVLGAEDGSRHWIDLGTNTDGGPLPRGYVAHTQGAVEERPGARSVDLVDLDAGTTARIPLPDGQQWTEAFTGDTLLTTTGGPDHTTSLHLLTATDGGVEDRTVTGALPDDNGGVGVSATGPGMAVLTSVDLDAHPNTHPAYALDLRTGTLTRIFADVSAPSLQHYVVGADRVGVCSDYSCTSLYTVSRDDLAGPSERTSLPVSPNGTAGSLALVGDHVLVGQWASARWGGAVSAVPLAGGPAQEVVAGTSEESSLAVGPDGTVLVVGGTDVDDWGVQRIRQASDGTFAATLVRALRSPAHVSGISVSGGQLAYTTDEPEQISTLRRSVSQDSPPAVGDPQTLGTGPTTGPLVGRGDGSFVRQDGSGTTVSPPVVGPDDSRQPAGYPAQRAAISDASLDYAVFYDKTYGITDVVGLRPGFQDREFVGGVNALWADTLWRPGATAGTVQAYDLRSGRVTQTVSIGSSCVPDSLQADGLWLYWSCGSSAGVRDLRDGHEIAVPPGTTQLGDGFLVRDDTAAGKLVLTDFHTGTATSQDLADFTGTAAGGPGITWSVDKVSGTLAYVDTAQQIHLRHIDVPPGPVWVLGSVPWYSGNIDLGPGPVPAADAWRWSPVLSRPATSWALTVRGSTGAVVATVSGSSVSGTWTPSLVWDYTDQAGHAVRDGVYSWSAAFADGSAAPATPTTAGTLTVRGGAAWRDFTGDGTGDLLALTPGGRLDVRPGNGKGGIGAGPGAQGWPTTSTYVPFTDLDGDRCNDLLVRNAAGQLWRYAGQCGKAFVPSGARTLIGGGWNVYNTLIAPGDLTGDGRADLLARTPSGDLYLYATTSSGVFAPRVKIGWGFGIYSVMTGMGGAADGEPGSLVARDSAGVLWNYVTSGQGGLQTRQRIGAGWNIYNSLVGVGRLDDGSPYLVARDGAGDLWRYRYAWTGAVGPRVKIGWAWQTYRSLL
ncbi:FG-GAP-like repeat-containing protein [Actinacidiphila acidipaludis]|uniref:FG-GAP-like repeat-containing protein n=1 Tax=Actinacidiphila acidipaludis TaxID=2873382 RepID=A0ABS7Q6N5_9ACTN|nr:FG-GAP-like repeat-containing protein [Streptomyces acidipaludis]MBY8877439.1 FG-GAP-like repeat-containing protein [Streptomyces acidipaludis]